MENKLIEKKELPTLTLKEIHNQIEFYKQSIAQNTGALMHCLNLLKAYKFPEEKKEK